MNELQQAAQRYADLYDLAPVGYVSFDRSGRTAEANLTAAQLLRLPRERIIGMPFAVFVWREDTPLFLHHLLRCRNAHAHVETELRLKNSKREIIQAQLCSTPMNASRNNGATLFQTSIIDITDRKTAEAQINQERRRQTALYAFARCIADAKSLDVVYNAALDTILSGLQCDRASILLYDANAVMRFVAWRGLSERYRGAVEGHSPWEPRTKGPEPICISDIDTAKLAKSLKATIRAEGIRAAAFIPLVSDQKLIGKFMAYYDSPHTCSDDELKLATTIAQHLTQVVQHQRDEEALHESEAQMRATIEQATAGVARCDMNGRMTFVNRAFCQMLGYTESELVGKALAEVTHRDDVDKNMLLFQRMIRNGNGFELEKRYIRRDGSVLWVDVSVGGVRGLDGKIQSAVAVIVDVTARKDAEAALQRSNELLEQRVRDRTRELRATNNELQNEIQRRKGVEGEILTVSDREQQRLGRELHDGLCQHLTAVAFMTRSMALRLKNHRVIDADDIEKIADLVNRAAVDTRNLSRALHRVDVDAPGLVNAMQDLVDREIWRTPCRLEVKPSFHIDNDVSAAHLHRIAREAVINANKHARARQIVVKLERVRQEMVLRVIDDGIGFPKELKPQQGLGYHIMQYRARLMGGRLEIDSPPQGGTRLSCYFPVVTSGSRKLQRGNVLPNGAPKLAEATDMADQNFQHLTRQGAANA